MKQDTKRIITFTALACLVLLCVLFHTWSNAITNTFMPTGDLKTIAGFALEGVISMIILILCEKGVIKTAKPRI